MDIGVSSRRREARQEFSPYAKASVSKTAMCKPPLSVSDVLNIPGESIADPPELATDGNTSCITGMGKLGERIVMLLDTGKLIGAEPLSVELEQVA